MKRLASVDEDRRQTYPREGEDANAMIHQLLGLFPDDNQDRSEGNENIGKAVAGIIAIRLEYVKRMQKQEAESLKKRQGTSSVERDCDET